MHNFLKAEIIFFWFVTTLYTVQCKNTYFEKVPVRRLSDCPTMLMNNADVSNGNNIDAKKLLVLFKDVSCRDTTMINKLDYCLEFPIYLEAFREFIRLDDAMSLFIQEKPHLRKIKSEVIETFDAVCESLQSRKAKSGASINVKDYIGILTCFKETDGLFDNNVEEKLNALFDFLKADKGQSEANNKFLTAWEKYISSRKKYITASLLVIDAQRMFFTKSPEDAIKEFFVNTHKIEILRADNIVNILDSYKSRVKDEKLYMEVRDILISIAKSPQTNNFFKEWAVWNSEFKKFLTDLCKFYDNFVITEKSYSAFYNGAKEKLLFNKKKVSDFFLSLSDFQAFLNYKFSYTELVEGVVNSCSKDTSVVTLSESLKKDFGLFKNSEEKFRLSLNSALEEIKTHFAQTANAK